MNKAELNEILHAHSAWLRTDGKEGERAHLAAANLTGADLSGADLTGANITGADLSSANLYRASLAEAELFGANLSGADLSEALDAPPYFSISWSGHGEYGRRLHAVEQEGELVFSCGCFSGSEEELREYIAEGAEQHRASRTRALEIILELASMEGAK